MTSSVYLRWLTPMACTLLLAGCLASDTLDTSFDTLAAAREAGMVERGWIPGWVPEGAIALKEVHDVDNNTSALAFELPPDVKVALPEGCLFAHYAETLPGPFERRWWPRQAVLASRYTFFTCPAPHTGFEFVGMRRDGRHVLHWRTYGR